MLEKQEVNSGGELSREYLLACKDEKAGLSSEKMKQISAIDSAFDKLKSTEEVIRERKRFLKLAIEFSSEIGDYPNGNPELHAIAAAFCAKIGGNFKFIFYVY